MFLSLLFRYLAWPVLKLVGPLAFASIVSASSAPKRKKSPEKVKALHGVYVGVAFFLAVLFHISHRLFKRHQQSRAKEKKPSSVALERLSRDAAPEPQLAHDEDCSKAATEYTFNIGAAKRITINIGNESAGQSATEIKLELA